MFVKKLCLTAVLGAVLLWGCANQETLETVADVWDVPAMAAPRQISVELPEGAGAETLESDAGRLYVTDDYSLSLETLEAGDLDATLRQLTGRGKEDLTVMETQQGDTKRYEFVWAAAGETGEMLGRGAILDDGNYHYCMSLLRPAEKVSQVLWNPVFESFSLEP